MTLRTVMLHVQPSSWRKEEMKPRRQSRITLSPIGFVRTNAIEGDFKTHRQEVISQIVLSEEYAAGLKGIEEYSHIFVIFWLNKVTKSERRALLTHPKHRRDFREIGVFGTRQRNHPNPIGLTVVELMERRSNVLIVKGLDALDGSPVLEIKPYNYRDRLSKIKVPDWWLKSKDQKARS